MPSTGFYLFLLLFVFRSKPCCSVSMPSTGFYLFLLTYEDIKESCSKMCQCPQRASTYFFTQIVAVLIDLGIGVNALNGLLLISSWKPATQPIHIMCQCPQRASTYFFQRKNLKTKIFHMCQCPQRASTYFFKEDMFVQKDSTLCQCPQRASTYFFLPENRWYRKWGEMPCVNALNGLLLISSIKSNGGRYFTVNVSMPSTGFYLFLPEIQKILKLL